MIALDDMDAFFLHKALPPQLPGTEEKLRRIMRLKIDGWTEADVRAEIIDPLVHLLGYDKESYFSLNREKSIEVLGNHKALDYSMTLFSENYWLIEAKRPHASENFGTDALYQALRYAAHPSINAALLVLCDGNKIEVFDREVTLSQPVLHVDRQHFFRDFDQLRSLLSPWQAFFFEKRRVLRLIDKVFSKELHFGRLEELREAMDRRAVGHRATVLSNFRQHVDLDADASAFTEHLKVADAEDIIEVHWPIGQTVANTDTIQARLVEACTSSSFRILRRAFPDHPRDANQDFWCHALDLLIGLTDNHVQVTWLPAWLNAGHPLDVRIATQNLIRLCLTHFESDRPRKIVLLHSAAIRRVAKANMMVSPKARNIGKLRHLIERHMADELSFSQAASSPERHLILLLDRVEIVATANFVRALKDQNGRINESAGLQGLHELWKAEAEIIQRVPDFQGLRKEMDFGEVFPTEGNGTCYDQLGHTALCFLERSPEWKAWTIQNLANEVQTLSSFGSWQARKWLGLNHESDVAPPTRQENADRFFLVMPIRSGPNPGGFGHVEVPCLHVWLELAAI